ncbi:hypothetical protein KTR66_04610 [Roseococcus sp. SDR]|uniref:hypothetical protein n=1 Tax=Roseococcus sp. SDR TaxID=2835532 RepID=UPI001BCAC879|nr:hypothetical protein [Roseococcus sp. SDR]MBS7789261.1 hypothetical protein [Roseococcus sp. SDR]MBV1844575.1 hypothetical protein [Roseococcus sp. SDR]
MSAVVKFPTGFDGPPPPPPPDEPPPEREEDGCTVGFLGQLGDCFWFFDYLGQIRELTARKIGQSGEIAALFGAKGCEWLAREFPARDKEGEIIPDQFAVRRVNYWIIRRSGALGLFNKDMPRRGIGVWRVGPRVVLHVGNRILWGRRKPGEDDVWRDPGFREDDALWPALPPVPCPDRAATPGQLARLQEMLRRWNWRDRMGAEVVFGLWAAAQMGAAIPWRPHGFIVAEPGSGKSTLFFVLRAASPLSTLIDDYTEAGIRQLITGSACGVMLDEADPDDHLAAEKLQRVIGFIRRTSGGKGATAVRGGAGGQSQAFQAVASFLMCGTLSPNLLPADASRITSIGLLSLDREARAPTEAEVADIEALGPALLGRVMQALPRFPAAFQAAREQIMARDGGSQRVADQIGTILAARWVVLHDDPFPSHADELDDLAWAMPGDEERELDGAPRTCWHHLLHSGLESYRKGDRPTVRSMIIEAMRSEGVPEQARRDLFDHGLRVGPYPLSGSGPPGLYVMNKHPRLAAIFKDTRWEGGKWGEELSRLRQGEAEAVRPPLPVTLARGEKHRCVWVPGVFLPVATDWRDGRDDPGE